MRPLLLSHNSHGVSLIRTDLHAERARIVQSLLADMIERFPTDRALLVHMRERIQHEDEQGFVVLPHSATSYPDDAHG